MSTIPSAILTPVYRRFPFALARYRLVLFYISFCVVKFHFLCATLCKRAYTTQTHVNNAVIWAN